MFTASGLAAGPHALTASYAGNSTHAASTSAAVSRTVFLPATATALAVGPTPPVYGRPVTLTATVTPADPASGVPTGAVTFYDGAAAVGSASLDGAGVATVTLAGGLGWGEHHLTAEYAGDAGHAGSTSAAVTVTPADVVSVAAGAAAVEGGAGGVLTFTRLGTGGALRAYFDLGGTAGLGADYTLTGAGGAGATGRWVDIPAGATSATVTVTALRDNRVEGAEAVAAAVTAGAGYAAGASAPLTIADDPPVVWVEGAAAAVTVAEGGTARLTLRRTGGDTTAPLTVTLSAGPDAAGDPVATGYTLWADGVEVSGGAVTFAAGDADIDLGVATVQRVLEASSPARTGVRVTVAAGGDGYVAGGPGQAAGWDVRVDARPSPVKQFVAITQGQTATVTLAARAPAGNPLAYTLFGSYGPELALAGDTVTYTPGADFTGDYTFYFQPHGTVATPAGAVVLDGNLGVVRVHVTPAPVPPEAPPPPVPPADLPNEAPTVEIEESVWFLHAGDDLTLGATADDPNGAADIVSVAWSFDYDGVTFTPDPAATTLSPTHTFTTPGIYLVAVRVTDGDGETATDVASVVVMVPDDPTPDQEIGDEDGGTSPPPPAAPPPPASPPVSPPFAPSVTPSATTVPVGGSVVFTVAGGSADGWADWDFNYDGTHFEYVSSGLTVGHAFVGPGTYTVAADVYDADGNETVVTATVTVTDAPVPVVFSPADVYGEEGTPVAFAAPAPPWAWLDVAGQPDPTIGINPASVRWDFGFDGTFDPDPAADGLAAPTHLYAPGSHVAAVRFADTLGNEAVAAFNVWVDAAWHDPPEVDAGTDQTVNAGSPVSFAGAATSAGAVTLLKWDFDYDGETFDADATGTATPVRVYLASGTYRVALMAVDATGAEAVDEVTVTVTNVAPTGTAAVAATRPDGSAQSFVEGSAVYFALTGVGDTDPDDPPTVWADWDGDGFYDLLTPDTWEAVETAPDGTQSFVVSHVYADGGSHSPEFWVEDAEGLNAWTGLTVEVGNAAPVALLTPVPPAFEFWQPVALSLGPVADPSAADAAAGFTYYFQLDGGGYQPVFGPDYRPAGLVAGMHTVDAYVADKDGGAGPVSSAAFRVLSDTYFYAGGTGAVALAWTNADGTPGAVTVAAGQTYIFEQAVSGVSATLQTDGATYDLATNASLDGVNGAALSGVTLSVRTDAADPHYKFIGDGHIEPVSVGPGGTVTVAARGDFGGLQGGAATYAKSLTFANQVGAIVAQWADRIVGTGAVSNVSVAGYVKELAGRSVADFQTGFAPNQTPVPMTLTVGPGGISGSNSTGVQSRAYYEVDEQGRVLLYRPDFFEPLAYVRYTYDANGLPATVQDRFGTVTYGLDAGGARVVVSDNRTGAPPGVPVGSAPAPAPAAPAPTGWAATVWSGAATLYSNVSSAAAAMTVTIVSDIQAAGRTIHAWASETWTKAGETVTWAYDQAKGAALYIGDAVVSASKEAAERFVKTLSEFGGTFAQLWDKIKALAGNSLDKATAILTQLVANPGQFAERLFTSVKDGITAFFNGIEATAKDAVMKWLFGDLGNLTPYPDWTNLAAVGNWLVEKVFGLTWENVQGVLVDKVGAGNVALAAQVLEYVQAAATGGGGPAALLDWLKAQGEGITAGELATEAVTAAAAAVGKRLVPPILAKVADVFVGGAGTVVTTIYNAVTWLVDNLGRLENMAGLLGTIVGRLDAVVRGDMVQVLGPNGQPLYDEAGNKVMAPAGAVMAGEIKKFLDTGVPVLLTFAVSQIPGLNTLPAAIRETIATVRATPLRLINRAATKVADKAKALFAAKATDPADKSLLAPRLEVKVGGHTVRLWVVQRNGAAVVMRSVDNGPEAELDLAKDLGKAVPPALVAKIQAALAELKRDAAAAIQAAKAAAAPPVVRAAQPGSVSAAAANLVRLIGELNADLRDVLDPMAEGKAECIYGNACFAAGTPLRTPCGWRAIEDLRPGDTVLARSEFDPHGPVEYKLVEEVFRRTAELWALGVDGRTIETTGEHPFYAWGRGWVACRELKVGDTVLCEGGEWRAVERVESTGRWAAVYNLRVADHHTYFVGNPEWGFSVWAHNTYEIIDASQVRMNRDVPGFPAMDAVERGSTMTAYARWVDNGTVRWARITTGNRGSIIPREQATGNMIPGITTENYGHAEAQAVYFMRNRGIDHLDLFIPAWGIVHNPDGSITEQFGPCGFCRPTFGSRRSVGAALPASSSMTVSWIDQAGDIAQAVFGQGGIR